MKSFFTLLLLTFSSTFYLQAQNLRLIDLNGNDITNTTFSDVVDTNSLDPYELDLDVANLASTALSVNCSREYNAITPLAESYFCWDVCYLPMVSISNSSLTVNANDTLKGYFHAYFRTNFESGTSVMRYKFTNTANAADTASITIILYAGTLGVKETNYAAKNKLSAAYPNPTAGAISINYFVENSANSFLKISNELGQVVFEKPLEANRGTILLPSSVLQPGVYFYSLYSGNLQGETKKLIITQ